MAHDERHFEFDSPHARLRCGGLAAQVDVSRPQLGAHDLVVNATKIAGALFAAEWISDENVGNPGKSAISAPWPMNVEDAYVRGGDLVATYGRFQESHYAPQIYWRLERPESSMFGGLSLLVSVQTDLLDSHPRIRVTTRLPADEVFRLEAPGPACLLWRLAGGKISYAEIVAESDFCDVETASGADGLSSARWELFAEFLEKGVIRRAQISGVFLPRVGDIDLATECCQAIARRPLPLTT